MDTQYLEPDLRLRHLDKCHCKPEILGLRRQLQRLWSAHSEQNETRGPGTSREDCEKALATARRLWSECESFIYTAAEDDEDREVLAESRKLLAACDDLIALKEEILRLCDGR